MVIKIKPPPKPGSASAAGVLRGSLDEHEGPSWSPHRPQEGGGEAPGGQWQPSRPGRAKGSCGAEDPLPVCRRAPGKLRVVKSMSSVSDSPSEPRRTVSESAVVAKARFLPSSAPQRGSAAPGRKVGSHSVASCVPQLLGDGRTSAGHPDQAAASGLVAGPARAAAGPRPMREPSLLVTCRASKFRKNNYKWVAASAKSPRAPRKALSPRAVAENVCKAPFSAAERAEKPHLRADPDAKPRRAAVAAAALPGASSSKYKWKASSSSASSASSFRWQSEAGAKDRASQPSPAPSRPPPGDRPAGGPGSSELLLGETPPSAYRVKSRTKIIRRRASAGYASLPGPGPRLGRPGRGGLGQAGPPWSASRLLGPGLGLRPRDCWPRDLSEGPQHGPGLAWGPQPGGDRWGAACKRPLSPVGGRLDAAGRLPCWFHRVGGWAALCPGRELGRRPWLQPVRWGGRPPLRGQLTGCATPSLNAGRLHRARPLGLVLRRLRGGVGAPCSVWAQALSCGRC